MRDALLRSLGIDEDLDEGNADTERVFRTLKEDVVWTVDWQDPFEFQSELECWISNYNSDFSHKSLNYRTPVQFMAHFSLKEISMA